MNLFESVGAGVKAVAASLSPAGNTPFSNWGTGLMGSSSASGYLGPGAVSGQGDVGVATATGSRDDYSADVGDISLNGVVSAAVSAIAEAFCAAPFILEQFDGQGWNRVDSHPCIELLHNPNPHYGREQLWEAEIAGELITGNGYMRAVWNQARTQPVELWHESLVAPVFDLHHFIGSYRIFVDGRPYPLAASALFGKDDDPMKGARIDHALHFRYRLNRRNPRFGESPLISVFPAIAGDNVASTWQTAVLKNGAGASFFITTKEGADIHPKQMEELLSQVERRLRREGAGRVAGTNLPVDFHKTSFSPDELALDKLPAHYEARICAALKVPPMILGLGAGEDHKTYSNFGESVDDFWQRNIIPFQNRKGAELEAQLFPLFDMDKSEWRIGFDRSQIAALQDDEGALYERVTKAVAGGWMQPNEAREKAKLPALEEEKKDNAEDPEESDEDEATKADLSWEESKHPRADDGKFGSGTSVFHLDVVSTGYPMNLIDSEMVDKEVPHAEHPFLPKGTPVKNGLKIEPKDQGLASILNVVGKLHGDGDLPTIPFRHEGKTASKGEMGRYGISTYKNRVIDRVLARFIRIAADNPTPTLTVLHELGHFLDHKGLGDDAEERSDFSTLVSLRLGNPNENQPEMWKDFHAAVTASKSFEILSELATLTTLEETNEKTGKPIEYEVNPKFAAYLLQPDEIFARAYCQYIVTRSGYQPLRKQLCSKIVFDRVNDYGSAKPDSLHYPQFWSAEDFVPIAESLDKLFVNHDWMTRQKAQNGVNLEPNKP